MMMMTMTMKATRTLARQFISSVTWYFLDQEFKKKIHRDFTGIDAKFHTCTHAVVMATHLNAAVPDESLWCPSASLGQSVARGVVRWFVARIGRPSLVGPLSFDYIRIHSKLRFIGGLQSSVWNGVIAIVTCMMVEERFLGQVVRWWAERGRSLWLWRHFGCRWWWCSMKFRFQESYSLFLWSHYDVISPTFIHPTIHLSIHKFISALIHLSIRPFIHSSIQPGVLLFARLHLNLLNLNLFLLIHVFFKYKILFNQLLLIFHSSFPTIDPSLCNLFPFTNSPHSHLEVDK